MEPGRSQRHLVRIDGSVVKDHRSPGHQDQHGHHGSQDRLDRPVREPRPDEQLEKHDRHRNEEAAESEEESDDSGGVPGATLVDFVHAVERADHAGETATDRPQRQGNGHGQQAELFLGEQLIHGGGDAGSLTGEDTLDEAGDVLLDLRRKASSEKGIEHTERRHHGQDHGGEREQDPERDTGSEVADAAEIPTLRDIEHKGPGRAEPVDRIGHRYRVLTVGPSTEDGYGRVS